MKYIIGFTMMGALIVAGLVFTILSVAVAVVKRMNMNGTKQPCPQAHSFSTFFSVILLYNFIIQSIDNDNQPLAYNIHLECVHFNQELCEKEDQIQMLTSESHAL